MARRLRKACLALNVVNKVQNMTTTRQIAQWAPEAPGHLSGVSVLDYIYARFRTIYITEYIDTRVSCNIISQLMALNQMPDSPDPLPGRRVVPPPSTSVTGVSGFGAARTQAPVLPSTTFQPLCPPNPLPSDFPEYTDWRPPRWYAPLQPQRQISVVNTPQVAEAQSRWNDVEPSMVGMESKSTTGRDTQPSTSTAQTSADWREIPPAPSTSPEMNIIINCPGAAVEACFAIIDVMARLKKVAFLNTIVCGEARGLASLLFAFGTVGCRVMSENSIVTVDIKPPVQARHSYTTLAHTISEHQIFSNLITQYYTACCSIKREAGQVTHRPHQPIVDALSASANIEYSAKEAYALGLADYSTMNF